MQHLTTPSDVIEGSGNNDNYDVASVGDVDFDDDGWLGSKACMYGFAERTVDGCLFLFPITEAMGQGSTWKEEK